MFSIPRISRQLLLLAVLAGPLACPVAEACAQKRTYKQGVLIRFEGPIFPFTEKVLERQLERARKMGADLVVVEINSPGGEVESSFRCAEMLEAVTKLEFEKAALLRDQIDFLRTGKFDGETKSRPYRGRKFTKKKQRYGKPGK